MLVYLATSTVVAELPEGVTITETNLYVSTVDNLRIRETPELNGNVIGKIMRFEEVEYRGEKSTTQTSLEVDGDQISAPWIKVKTKQGVEGWIWGGLSEKIYKYKNQNEKYSFRYTESASFESYPQHPNHNFTIKKRLYYQMQIFIINNYKFDSNIPRHDWGSFRNNIVIDKVFYTEKIYQYQDGEGGARFVVSYDLLKKNNTMITFKLWAPRFLIAHVEPDYFMPAEINRSFLNEIFDTKDRVAFEKVLNKNTPYNVSYSKLLWYYINKYNGINYVSNIWINHDMMSEFYGKLLNKKTNHPIQYWWDLFDYIVSTVVIEEN